MARKKVKKGISPPKDATDKSRRQSKDDDGKGERDEWDFGGLPDRDLKKNLGCG
jgi:hypothetical protein